MTDDTSNSDDAPDESTTEPTLSTDSSASEPDGFEYPPTVELTRKLPPGSNDLFQSTVDSFDRLLGSAEDGIDDMSNDAFLQTVRDASNQLEAAGIERAERKDWILAAFKAAAYQRMTTGISDLEYQLQLLFDL